MVHDVDVAVDILIGARREKATTTANKKIWFREIFGRTCFQLYQFRVPTLLATSSTMQILRNITRGTRSHVPKSINGTYNIRQVAPTISFIDDDDDNKM